MKRILCITLLLLTIASTGHAFSKEGPTKTEGGTPVAPAEPALSEEEQQQIAAKKKKEREEARKIVAAKVNGISITMESVIGMMNRIGSKKTSESPAPQIDDVSGVQKEALHRLILQELAHQRAKAKGIQIDPRKIDGAIVNFKENLGGEAGYTNFLAAEGKTEQELRAQVERSLGIEQIYAEEVLGKVEIPENEVKQEYEKNKDKFFKPDRVVMTDVMVPLKGDAKSALKKAESLLKKIKAEKDQDPWKLTLDGTFIVRSLDLKDQRPKGLNKEIYEAAKKLKEGELSDLIKAPDSFHIIKLKEYSPERYYTLEEARGSIEGKFRYAAQQQRLTEWEKELKKEAKIEIIESEQKPPQTELKKEPAQ